MTGAPALYTPQVLGLATGLAAYPWNGELPLITGVRSKSCGSALDLGLALDGQGRIAAIGIRPHACAIGQAAAALFAQAALGRDGSEIRASRAALEAWLGGEGPLPDWPGLSVIAPARDYPARHGAILLAWRAASELLP